MDRTKELFLQALKAALEDRMVSWDFDIDARQWSDLFKMAESHQVLPMIFQAVYACPAIGTAPADMMGLLRSRTRQLVAMQQMKTAQFLPLLEKMKAAGLEPLVVKGIVCRSLYPKPDFRMSSDEDVLIQPPKLDRCHEIMADYGMEASGSTDAYEVPYTQKNGLLYIEVHRSLFPPENEAYGDLNRFFRHTRRRSVSVEVDGVQVPTMGHTDHFFYLICHAFKHFIHSGFGLRQVCDITLYANAFGRHIDWAQVMERCRQIRAQYFTAAILGIGETYLTFSPDQACLPSAWRNIQVEVLPMLEDLLDSGIYGGADMSRKHSATITVNAVAKDKTGRKNHSGVLQSIFPSARQLEGKYPYLQKHPALLPLAWTTRLLRYGKEVAASSDNRPGDSMRIGNQRVNLLQRYKIIDE